ncbi:hypothetical protein WA158_007464 [Blastocystis sp. Blastoise]
MMSDDYISATFRVVLSYYTPFINMLNEEQKLDHKNDDPLIIPDEYFTLLASSVDFVVSGEQHIYQRKTVNKKNFITVGYGTDKLYKSDFNNALLIMDEQSSHKQLAFGFIQIYDCSLIIKTVNQRKQSVDTYSTRSTLARCK